MNDVFVSLFVGFQNLRNNLVLISWLLVEQQKGQYQYAHSLFPICFYEDLHGIYQFHTRSCDTVIYGATIAIWTFNSKSSVVTGFWVTCPFSLPLSWPTKSCHAIAIILPIIPPDYQVYSAVPLDTRVWNQEKLAQVKSQSCTSMCAIIFSFTSLSHMKDCEGFNSTEAKIHPTGSSFLKWNVKWDKLLNSFGINTFHIIPCGVYSLIIHWQWKELITQPFVFLSSH